MAVLGIPEEDSLGDLGVMEVAVLIKEVAVSTTTTARLIPAMLEPRTGHRIILALLILVAGMEGMEGTVGQEVVEAMEEAPTKVMEAATRPLKEVEGLAVLATLSAEGTTHQEAGLMEEVNGDSLFD